MPIEIAERFFAETEAVDLLDMTEKLRAERFCELWTLKEAYIKARGIGLSLKLDSFGFDLSDGAIIRFWNIANVGHSNEEWRFWQLSPVNGFVVAVCVRRTPGLTEKLSVRKLVPLCSESVVCCSMLRQSLDQGLRGR